MAVKLFLRNRPAERAQVGVQDVLEFLNRPISDAEKVKALKDALAPYPQTVHDREWLMTIVNWAPQGGHAFTELAKWTKLAKRVGDLEDREGWFTLSDYQAGLIWSRLQKDEFKIVRFSPALAGFVLDFCEAAGKSFGGDQDDEELAEFEPASDPNGRVDKMLKQAGVDDGH